MLWGEPHEQNPIFTTGLDFFEWFLPSNPKNKKLLLARPIDDANH
jgi:hypothetical protein